jgi:hypothetical protein
MASSRVGDKTSMRGDLFPDLVSFIMDDRAGMPKAATREKKTK